jgi:peroxiredoxin
MHRQVIGTDGKVAKVWSTVKGVAKHPEEVLEFVKTM